MVWTFFGLQPTAKLHELLAASQQLCSRPWADVHASLGSHTNTERFCMWGPYMAELLQQVGWLVCHACELAAAYQLGEVPRTGSCCMPSRTPACPLLEREGGISPHVGPAPPTGARVPLTSYSLAACSSHAGPGPG